MRTAPSVDPMFRQRHGGVCLLFAVLVAFLCCCLGAWAQTDGIEIRSPQPDPAKPGELPTVRGAHKLSASKPNPGEGWVSIVLTDGPGVKEPQFLAAVVAPYSFTWDTRRRQAGKRVYPDGQYTLQFSAHQPTGETIGTKTISTQIQNDVNAAEIGDAIELRHQYVPRERTRYTVKGQSRLELPTQLRPLEKVLESMQSELDLAYTSVVMDVGPVSPDRPDTIEAMIRNTPRDGIYEAQGQAPRLFPGLGRSMSVKARNNGLILPMRPEIGRFGFGEMYIVLPSGPVKLGHRWTSEASVMPEFSTAQRQVVPAQHVLEGFEWLHGQKCARIRSTYQYRGYVTVVVDGAGLNVQTTMQGERATYFAYETGQTLLIEEDNNHKLLVDLEQVGKTPDRGGGDDDDEDEDEDEEEEDEEEEDEDEDASAGRPHYVTAPASDMGTVFFAQVRPTVRPPGAARPPAAGRAVRGPARGGAVAAPAAGGLVVPVPYNVHIRIERGESGATAPQG